MITGPEGYDPKLCGENTANITANSRRLAEGHAEFVKVRRSIGIIEVDTAEVKVELKKLNDYKVERNKLVLGLVVAIIAVLGSVGTTFITGVFAIVVTVINLYGERLGG